jgi:hypothetical protein
MESVVVACTARRGKAVFSQGVTPERMHCREQVIITLGAQGCESVQGTAQ